ncbi:restriction endonuclease subunit S [Yersinia aleksiciae]|uniref:restriction endonuclease subunit S n=1 Tax=Yersinia aleksiciae TaxID=263819 RepID=UPI001427B733|nr:restriction endonuclease subunit S [Yersinia aleksiciae]MDA5498629.1 restriction endonuclease subunit S [Yersinia aleksiciae]NIK99324.1 restriction endonuclease subunit S [Yersinia aleksiciae]WQC71282.1 restriction endonuclease subunit S [Yersinia aleksiciae]
MSELSYLNKLLTGGNVEWKPLGEIAEYSTTRIDASKLDATSFTGVDNLVSNKGGRIDANYLPNTTRLTAYEPGDILLGNIRPYLKKVWMATDSGGCSGDVLAVRIRYECRSFVNPIFLYFILSSDVFFSYSMQHAKGAKMPRGSKTDILNYKIPIPCPNDPEKSLAIQSEIVRILDTFTAFSTELTAELTAELTLRKKQYNYYRDQLLSFDRDKVEFKTLGVLAENLDSNRKPITSGLRETGNIPYYGASGIVDYVKDYIFEGDFLLVSEDGANLLARNTPIAFSISGKTWVNNHAHVLKFDTYAERRFVEYYLNSIDLTTYISGAAQPKLNKKNLESISIPNPSHVEKERIVSTLDKIDTLANSITESLAREIELRQKQYEYYRDLILSFPKLNVKGCA